MLPRLLLNGVLSSVLGGRRKPSRHALRFLTRGTGGLVSTALSHPEAMLTAAGVAWGIFDTLQGDQGGTGASTGAGLGAPAASAPPPAAGIAPQGGGPVVPPPLPTSAAAPPASSVLADDALRMVRLAISAANADGSMNDHERAAIMQQAREAGVGDLVERELAERRPLAQIVAGVADPAQRATLYVLAFSVLRADEQLTGAERIYLAQLANLLHLDPEAAERLEKEAGERIDALGDQGQAGG